MIIKVATLHRLGCAEKMKCSGKNRNEKNLLSLLDKVFKKTLRILVYKIITILRFSITLKHILVKEMLKISKTKIDGICVENPPNLKETSTL